MSEDRHYDRDEHMLVLRSKSDSHSKSVKEVVDEGRKQVEVAGATLTSEIFKAGLLIFRSLVGIF